MEITIFLNNGKSLTAEVESFDEVEFSNKANVPENQFVHIAGSSLIKHSIVGVVPSDTIKIEQ